MAVLQAFERIPVMATRYAVRLLARLYHSRMVFIVVVLLFLPVIGTAGYMLIEGWSWFDALYMSVITLTTVGYLEVQQMSTAGRVFTMVYLFAGVGTAFYSLTILAEKVLLSEALTQKIINAQLRTMDRHYIVCGYGRTGRRIVAELRQLRKPFVAIDINKSRVEALQREGIPAIVGDAADEAVLMRAGIHNAIGLVSALDDDASNVFVVLTARGLNEHVHIVARAENIDAEPKLKRAGANAILSPHEIGAVRLTHMLLNRSFIDSFDLVTQKLAVDVAIAEFTIEQGHALAGATLKDVDIAGRFGGLVLAVKHANQEIEFPPSVDTLVEPGSVLIIAAAGVAMQQIHGFFRDSDS